MKDIDLRSREELVNDIFRKNLKLLRTANAVTGKDLSSLLSMSKMRIHDLEEGRVTPTLSDMIKIVDHFPITFNDLLEYEITLDIKSRTT